MGGAKATGGEKAKARTKALDAVVVEAVYDVIMQPVTTSCTEDVCYCWIKEVATTSLWTEVIWLEYLYRQHKMHVLHLLH